VKEAKSAKLAANKVPAGRKKQVCAMTGRLFMANIYRNCIWTCRKLENLFIFVLFTNYAE